MSSYGASLAYADRRYVNPPPAVVVVRGTITDRMAMGVVRQIEDAPRRAEVTVRIDSGGGLIGAAQDIAAALRARRAPVRGHVTGRCSSAAVLVLAACRNSRWAGPEARFLFHPVARPDPIISSRLTGPTLRAAAAELDAADAAFAQLIASWTGGEREIFAALARDERTIDARRALDLDLLTAVLGEPSWLEERNCRRAEVAARRERMREANKSAAETDRRIAAMVGVA